MLARTGCLGRVQLLPVTLRLASRRWAERVNLRATMGYA